jgi:hypothetical protein
MTGTCLVLYDSVRPDRRAGRHASYASHFLVRTEALDQTILYMVLYCTQGSPRVQTHRSYPRLADSTQPAGGNDYAGDVLVCLFSPPPEYIVILFGGYNLVSLRDETFVRTTAPQVHSNQNISSAPQECRESSFQFSLKNATETQSQETVPR